MLIAGADTSSGTMEWAMAFLVNNPAALQTAQAEIDDKVGQSRLLEECDLDDLRYLQAIVKETLRMRPPGPILPPHESSTEVTIGEYRVPPGTMLLVNAWAMQNDSKLWEKPEEFRPERWVEGGGMKGKEFCYLPFGAGRRRCHGEALALRVVILVVGLLVQCFEWRRLGEQMEDMSEGFGLTSPKATPLVAKCRPRRSAALLLQQL